MEPVIGLMEEGEEARRQQLRQEVAGCWCMVGTSLAAVLTTGAGGALSYGAAGAVDWEVGRG